MTFKKTVAALGAASTMCFGVAAAAPITLAFEGQSTSGDTAVTFEIVLDQDLESRASTGGVFGGPGPVKLFDPNAGVLSIEVAVTDISTGETVLADLSDFDFGNINVGQKLRQTEGADGSGSFGISAFDGPNLLTLSLASLQPTDPDFVPNVLFFDGTRLLSGLPQTGVIDLDLLRSASLTLGGAVFETVLAEDSQLLGGQQIAAAFDFTSIRIGELDDMAAVPLPAAAFLFVPAFGALAVARRRKA